MNVRDRGRIGIIDSGIGGLSIYKELIKKLPRADTIYIGDEAYFPYGEKTEKQIQSRLSMLVERLMREDCGIVVLACNSATVSAIDYLRKRFDLTFVGTEPVVKPAVKLTKSGRIAILATPVTVRSARHKSLIKKYADNIAVLNKECEELAEAIEAGVSASKLRTVIDTCVRPVREFGPDVVGLACTHYPLAAREIRKSLGPKIKIIDSGEAIAKRVKTLGFGQKGGGKHVFYTTGSALKFDRLAKKYLGLQVRSGAIKAA